MQESFAGGSPLLTRGIKALAEPRLTVVFFVATGLCALAVGLGGVRPTLAMLVPFALLVLNLGAAVVTHPRFRIDVPLLVFHLSLLVFIGLLVWARLTYLDGQIVLTTGVPFDGRLEKQESGPFHGNGLQRLRFVNQGFTENYPLQGQYRSTYNRVGWVGPDGRWRQSDIGDDQPLVLDGYRIYTTRHRGYSPVFEWRNKEGVTELGTVQLDDVNAEVFAPDNSWRLAGGPEVWVMLDYKPREPVSGERVFNLGGQVLPHRLVLRVGDSRHVLSVGDSVALDGGQLTYVRLDSWMGYLVVWDATRPWIMATLFVAVISLIWFYWRKLWGNRSSIDGSA